MPQGVPVGGSLWVIVEVNWEYNDNYYYPEGNGDCRQAYTTQAGAEAAARKLNAAALLDLLEPAPFAHGLDSYIESGFDDYSSLDEAELLPQLAALGITEDEHHTIRVAHPGPWTEAELATLQGLLDLMGFYEVQEVTLEE